MAWCDKFIHHFGPGQLGGITLGNWIKLLRENQFAVAPSRLLRWLAISAQSCQNSLLSWGENRKFGSELQDLAVESPVFLLGHWRNGTTHLHNLLTVDERFAFPNNYQVLYPHTFLSTEAISSPLFQAFLPSRRPMDNVEWTMRSPQEDEYALSVATAKSPCMGWVFPWRRDHYDKYLTFRSVPEREIREWKAAFVLFLKKLTWKYRRPIVLKSPPHTCRVKLLLQMFPQSKFIHIHRNPYPVFQSSLRTFQVVQELHRLQRPRLNDLEEWVLRQYREMYDVFFEERGLIPAGHFHEVAYEQLEADPIGEVKRIYQALDLPEFASVEPVLRRYVESIAGYRKNEFPNLSAEWRRRIADAWQPCFDEWQYLGRHAPT
jgi:hypothetical protein